MDDAAAPVNPQGEGGDSQRQAQPAQFSDRSAPVAEADRIVRSAIEKMAGEQAFEAWRGPVEDAISSAFGDLDPEADDLVERFSERVPKFLDSLPSALSGMDAAAFRKTLEAAMLASFVDGLMPSSYWRKG